MRLSIIIFFFNCIFLFDAHGSANAIRATVTPEQKKRAETVIANCEARFQSVLNARNRIEAVKRPSIFPKNRDKKRDLYRKKPIILHAFDMNFDDMLRITNQKIGLRTATNAKELFDRSNAYSSNCIRFSNSLIEFVDWVLTGTITGSASEIKGKQFIYQEWLNDAKKEILAQSAAKSDSDD